MEKINLVMGDPWNDGHGKSSFVTIESNLSSKEIEKAYEKGAKKIGIDLSNEIASEYEDRLFSEEYYNIFSKAGYKFILSEYDLKDLQKDKEFSLDEDMFANLYLFVVQTGNPSFQYTIMKDDVSRIEIGGYGLFK